MGLQLPVKVRRLLAVASGQPAFLVWRQAFIVFRTFARDVWCLMVEGAHVSWVPAILGQYICLELFLTAEPLDLNFGHSFAAINCRRRPFDCHPVSSQISSMTWVAVYTFRQMGVLVTYVEGSVLQRWLHHTGD